MTDIEQIKSKIDIVSFVSEFVPLKKAGRHFKACCPFHSEKTPSFVVSPERGTWHCFGACGDGGDVIKFLQKWESIDFVDALKILAARAGITLSSLKPTETTRERDVLLEINHLAGEFYHFLLTKHPLGARAREYLEERHIRPEIVKTFLMGYAPNSWDGVLKYLTKKGYKREDIFTAGLIVRNDRGTYYDRFRGRLMFALRDARGTIVGFSGRKLPPQSEKEAKYVNSPETPVYTKGNVLYGLDVTKESIRKQKEVIVVEGEFDMLSSYQCGQDNVVAIKGSALTEGQTMLLKRYTEHVILGLDGDFAGNEAARRGIEIADAAGLTVRVVQLPVGKDPAECIAQGPHLWKKAVKDSVSVYDFVIDAALKKYDKKDAIGKGNISGEIVPFIVKISNPVIQSHYVKKLAAILEVSEESIESAMRKQANKYKSRMVQEVVAAAAPKTSREERIEEHLLSLLTQSQTPVETMETTTRIISAEDFTVPSIRKIYEILERYLKQHTELNIAELSAALSPELQPTFDTAFLADISRQIDSKEEFVKDVENTIREMKKLALSRKVNEISTKIRELENTGDDPHLASLQEELRRLLDAKGHIELRNEAVSR